MVWWISRFSGAVSVGRCIHDGERRWETYCFLQIGRGGPELLTVAWPWLCEDVRVGEEEEEEVERVKQ